MFVVLSAQKFWTLISSFASLEVALWNLGPESVPREQYFFELFCISIQCH